MNDTIKLLIILNYVGNAKSVKQACFLTHFWSKLGRISPFLL